MYPNLYYACKDLFGIELSFLRAINTAGFFVALAFIAGGWYWEHQLRRMQAAGLLTSRPRRLRWRSDPEKKIIQEWPADWTPRVTILSALIALLGAKIFAAFENWSAFVKDPLKTLLSPAGFVFYGGLVAAFIIMWIYHRRWGQERFRIVDALGPSLLLAYGIGRLGCHVSGDGDWGINNLGPKPVSWMPDWLWAYHYPHNIIKQGIYMKGCDWGDYCYQLAAPVFPTPLYEFGISMLFLIVLRLLRNRIRIAGRIAALYLILTGVGRLLIEQIRVNISYFVGGVTFTQAELVSVLFILAGLMLYFIAPRLAINKRSGAPA